MSKHGTSIEYVATLDHCRYLKSYNPCYPLTKDKTHVSHDHTVRCLCAWLCLYMSRSMIMLRSWLVCSQRVVHFVTVVSHALFEMLYVYNYLNEALYPLVLFLTIV